MTRKRRAFTPEYKAEVVCLVRDGGKGIAAVARDLGGFVHPVWPTFDRLIWPTPSC